MPAAIDNEKPPIIAGSGRDLPTAQAGHGDSGELATRSELHGHGHGFQFPSI